MQSHTGYGGRGSERNREKKKEKRKKKERKKRTEKDFIKKSSEEIRKSRELEGKFLFLPLGYIQLV